MCSSVQHLAGFTMLVDGLCGAAAVVNNFTADVTVSCDGNFESNMSSQAIGQEVSCRLVQIIGLISLAWADCVP